MSSNFFLRHARTSGDVVEGSDQVRCDIWRRNHSEFKNIAVEKPLKSLFRSPEASRGKTRQTIVRTKVAQGKYEHIARFESCFRCLSRSNWLEIQKYSRWKAVEKSFLDLSQALERVMHSNFVLRHARTSADVVEGSDQVRCDIWRWNHSEFKNIAVEKPLKSRWKAFFDLQNVLRPVYSPRPSQTLSYAL